MLYPEQNQSLLESVQVRRLHGRGNGHGGDHVRVGLVTRSARTSTPSPLTQAGLAPARRCDEVEQAEQSSLVHADKRCKRQTGTGIAGSKGLSALC